MKTIKIACQGSHTLPLESLEILQGDLKDLSKENYQKLRKEILDLGFSSPVHVWENEGHHWVLDGTQRTRVLTEMKKEGFDIPELPCVMVDAEDEKQAKLKILSLTSNYGNMTSQGLYEFMSEADIKFDEVVESFCFPEIDMDVFKEEFLLTNDLDENTKQKEITHIIEVQLANEKDKSELYGELVSRGFIVRYK